MRGEGLNGLANRIRLELAELEHVLARINEGWQRAHPSGDDYYLDSVALNLHGFYSGLERVFTLIAETIDGSLPQGENWHLLLLQQMTEEKPRVRPAVISEEVGKRLNEYRGFRHVVRNVIPIASTQPKWKNSFHLRPTYSINCKPNSLPLPHF